MSVTVGIKGKRITFDVSTLGGTVVLVATHVDGVKHSGGYVAGVTSDGMLKKYSHVDESFGLTLNKATCIKTEKE